MATSQEEYRIRPRTCEADYRSPVQAERSKEKTTGRSPTTEPATEPGEQGEMAAPTNTPTRPAIKSPKRRGRICRDTGMTPKGAKNETAKELTIQLLTYREVLRTVCRIPEQERSTNNSEFYATTPQFWRQDPKTAPHQIEMLADAR